jgi:arginine/lysine/histidine/glutamine transport system substrate-binding and permease protein
MKQSSSFYQKFQRILRWGFFSLFFLMVGCGSSTSYTSYRIGMDPFWPGAFVQGKEDNLYAFFSELFQQMSEKSTIRLSWVFDSTENLLMHLKEERFEAILSALPPHRFLQDRYDFSDLCFATGPVLVVNQDSSISSLDQLQGKEVGLVNAKDRSLLETAPGVLIRDYDSIPDALNDLSENVLDAVLIAGPIASGYVNDLYANQLKIATPPLTTEGIRCISLEGENEDLIAWVNQGVKKAKESGLYAELLRKWRLG